MIVNLPQEQRLWDLGAGTPRTRPEAGEGCGLGDAVASHGRREIHLGDRRGLGVPSRKAVEDDCAVLPPPAGADDSAARLLASMVQLEQPIEERASPWTVRDESGRREQVPKEFLDSREAKPYHGQATSPGRQRQQLREGILGRYGSEGYEITARRPVGEVKDRWSDRQAMAAQQALDS